MSGGIPMNDKELFDQILEWSYHHCRDLWKEYNYCDEEEMRRHVARKLLIEKVKKEPDIELLISPALKKRILEKEGVDLKRINYEYQEKKGTLKVKQEKKIYNQKPCTDTDFKIDDINKLNLSENFSQEWNKHKWYSVSAIASKLGIHRNSVAYWRDFGIKINGSELPNRLKMIKRPNLWYSKGKWIIEFFLKPNGDVEVDGD
jgi:hypothetical protein